MSAGSVVVAGHVPESLDEMRRSFRRGAAETLSVRRRVDGAKPGDVVKGNAHVLVGGAAFQVSDAYAGAHFRD
jgi:hypothetical protein